MKTKKEGEFKSIFIVDWNGLAEYYKEAGLKTVISELELLTKLEYYAKNNSDNFLFHIGY